MSSDLTPDWILQQTLSVQRQAIMDYVNGQAAGDGLTLTVIGCGELEMLLRIWSMGLTIHKVPWASLSSVASWIPSRL